MTRMVLAAVVLLLSGCAAPPAARPAVTAAGRDAESASVARTLPDPRRGTALVALTDSIRVPAVERGALASYLPTLVRDAWAELDARWQHGLAQPPMITLYRSPDAFARATGASVPDAVQGTLLGGNVGIAMLSPGGGALAWGRTLWHELVHVVAGSLSDDRAPRWFVEGLAEHETNDSHPLWRRRVAPLLATVHLAGALPSLRDLEASFGTRGLERDYAHALLAVEHVVTHHGRAKVREMLLRWGEGLATDAVVSRSLGVSLDALDASIRRDLSSYVSSRDPVAYEASLSRAAAAGERGDRGVAKEALEAATRVDPDRVDAWAELLRLGRSLDDASVTERAVERVALLDPYARDVLGYWLPLLARDGRWQELADAAWALLAIDPTRADARELLDRAQRELRGLR